MVLGEHVGVLLEQADAFEQQVAEIDGVQRFEAGLVVGVELLGLAVGIDAGLARRDVGGQQAAVLPVVEHAGEGAGRPALLVDVLGLEQLLDQADLVVGIEDGEIGFEADELGVAANDAGADGVEGAEPRHALDGGADEVRDALLHLAGGLVGEGHREDFAAAGEARGEDVGDAGGEDAGLAGAGAGEHQQRPIGGQHGLALLLVEALEVVGIAPAELAGDRTAGGRFRRIEAGRSRHGHTA